MKYKFKGKTKNGQWIYGMPTYDFRYIFNDDSAQYASPDNFEVDPETVVPYIMSINGVDLYEGDFVKRWGEESPISLMEKKEHSDEFDAYVGYAISSNDKKIILIGNKFDNPELLKTIL